ncbi:MAG TPA: PA14 domain-containing protein [Rariglobus sp.]|nr:PA14 domain-containing protein [Rariglobus sp.]
MSNSQNKFVRYLKRFGAGSMLISIIIHVVIIISATVWVVSSSMPQRKPSFQGGGDKGSAGVQHAVKMSHTQPNLATLTQRIVVENSSSSVTLPDLPTPGKSGPGSLSPGGSLGEGPGAGQGAGIGNLKGPIMPAFGFKEAQPGGTLVGRFYDLKQFRDRKPNPALAKQGPAQLAVSEVSSFIKGGWNISSLSEFFQAPTTLYATQIFMPMMDASEAPKAYGVEDEVKPMSWIAHYKGKVSPPATGAYRFVGAGDDHLVVRIDGRLVLDGSGRMVSSFKTDRPKSPSYAYDYNFNNWMIMVRDGFTVGNRMELRAGQFYDIDIVVSEGPGGRFCAMILVEQEGATYAKDAKGNPILPIFRIAASDTEQTKNSPPFLANGPVWRALPAPNTVRPTIGIRP